MIGNYPLISVVIPVYNGERTILRAVKSVLNQSYPNIELRIVNDASKDETLEVLSEIKDKRVKVLSHKENKGGSAARNTGIKASKGQYVALLDDDDEWLPDKLMMQYRYLLDKDPKKWKAVITSYYYLSENDWSVVEFLKEGDLLEDMIMMKMNRSTVSSILMNKSVFKSVGYFDEKYRKFQDLEYIVRYLRKYKLAVVRKPLVRIYGEQGITRAEKVLNNKLLFLEDFKKDIEKLPKKMQHLVYARHWLQVARFFALDGRPRSAWYYMVKSLKHGILFSNRFKILPYETYFAIPIYLLRAWYLKRY